MMGSANQNCWEFNRCGREPGGANVATQGVCPAATTTKYNGVNGGQNAGRFCWPVAGTLCGGKVQGTLAQKATSCMSCKFYLQVVDDAGGAFILVPSQLE